MNTKTIQRIAIGATMLSAIILPGFAFAQTASTTDTSPTHIQSLFAQLQALEQQIHSLTGGHMGVASSTFSGSPAFIGSTTPMGIGSTTPAFVGHMMCLGLMRDLHLGSQGSDVTQLQQSLAQDPTIYPQGTVSGYYGPATAAAVGRLQAQYGVASSSSQGVVGPKTRALFKTACNPGEILGPVNGIMSSSTASSTDDTHRYIPRPFPLFPISSTTPVASSTQPHWPPYIPVPWPPVHPVSPIGSSTPSSPSTSTIPSTMMITHR